MGEGRAGWDGAEEPDGGGVRSRLTSPWCLCRSTAVPPLSEMEGVEPHPTDPWVTRELYIKWKRYSYIHCSWDTKATLSLLAGFKRVLNYMRKVRGREHVWVGE